MKHVVTVIVPAHNEEKGIGAVLDVLLQSADVDEIFCVDDGSDDDTSRIVAQKHAVKLIKLHKNFGKAYAVMQAVMQAKGDIVVFIDADLTGLSDENIHDLIAPLREETYDVSIGYRSHPFDKLMFMPLAGERAYFKKDLLPHAAKIQAKGYGMELYLNYLFKDKQIKLLGLKGVRHTMKYNKQKYMVAFRGLVFELGDLIKEIITKEDPVGFFINSYLYPFYIQTPKKKKR